MSKKKFARHTETIIRRLPHWFSIRKRNSNSIGADFLNVFGLELDDVRDILDYSYNQVYLSNVDVNMVDILYKGWMPGGLAINDVKMVVTGESALTRVNSLNDLIYNGVTYGDASILTSKPVYFYDESRDLFYVNEPYDKSSDCSNGVISIVLYDDKRVDIKLHIHHVWNYLDEFGMLIWCPRIKGENNLKYKNRLLDVFQNPANSSKEGLLNGIARGLDIRKWVTWEDRSKDFIITDPMIVLNYIKVNKECVDINDVYINSDGNVVLLGVPNNTTSATVEYISGIEMHRLNNKDDLSLISQLYKLDGSPSKLMLHYKNKLDEVAPTKWGHFSWDAAFFDSSDVNIGGTCCLENKSDSDISGFKDFKL